MTSPPIPAGSIILTPADARVLYQVARLDELRARYRVGSPAAAELLTAITRCAFTNADAGNLPRHPTASEDRDRWTVRRLAATTGRAPRTIRLDCETGTLPATKTAGAWTITAPDARTYLESWETA